MRNHRFHRALRRWLRLEAAGDRRAEAALRSVFAQLPREQPSPALLGRVLAGAGFARAPRDLRGLRWRALIAVSGALAATALGFLPTVVAGAGALARTGKPVELAVAGLAAAIERIGESLFLFDAVARVGSIVGSALASPAVLVILALCAAVSLVAFRLLEGLLVSDRSVYYAES